MLEGKSTGRREKTPLEKIAPAYLSVRMGLNDLLSVATRIFSFQDALC